MLFSLATYPFNVLGQTVDYDCSREHLSSAGYETETSRRAYLGQTASIKTLACPIALRTSYSVTDNRRFISRLLLQMLYGRATIAFSNAVDLRQRDARKARYLGIVRQYERDVIKTFSKVPSEVTWP